jgi:hypothetical protein
MKMDETGFDAGAGAAPALAGLVVPLLKGVMYQESDAGLWQSLLRLQPAVRDYVAVLGLELAVDEAEGYAFLRSRAQDDEDEAAPTPRLVARRPLSFPVSLLLALLRKKLAESDASGGDTRLVLGRDDIVELLRVFLPDISNEARVVDQVDAHINKIVDLGFLRRLKTGPGSAAGSDASYEVRRILKAFVDAQWLSGFSERLAAYRAQLATGKGDGNDA